MNSRVLKAWGSKPKVPNFSWNSFNRLVLISKNKLCCGMVTSCEYMGCLLSDGCAVTVKWVSLNMFGTSWEELSESVSLYTAPCLICASSFWKNGYTSFHNAMFKLSSIVCDTVLRHVEMLVVVPQNIDQIKWCLLKNNSCFINN